jgi:hypothetical protein
VWPKFLHRLLQRKPLLQGGRNFCRKAQKWQKNNKVAGKIGGRSLPEYYQKWQKIVQQNCCIFQIFI